MPESQTNPKWKSNKIQFPRLLAEIAATQPDLDMQAIADSMDLEVSDVDELFDRAQAEWEIILSLTFPQAVVYFRQ